MKKEKKIYKQPKHLSKQQNEVSRSRSRSNTPCDPMPNTPTQNTQKSKGSIYRSSNNRKWDCESHFLELKPIGGEKTHYNHTFYKFAH